MTNINEFVNVKVVDETKPFAGERFDIPLFISSHKVFDGNLRIVTDAQDVLDLGFGSSSQTYLAAVNYFSQEASGRLSELFLGRRESTQVSFLATTILANTDYTLQFSTDVGPVTITFDSGGAPTATTIANGLANLINLDGTLNTRVNVVVNVDVLELTNQANKDFGVYDVTKFFQVDELFTSSPTYPEAIDLVRDVNDDFYAISIDTHVQADVLEVAAHTESLITSEGTGKMFMTSSQDPETLNPASITDTMFKLKDANYRRSWIVYSSAADTNFIETAVAGAFLPSSPGTSVVAYKTLTGIVADLLTSTQSQAVRGTPQSGFTDGKHGNTYEKVSGTDIVIDGLTSAGEFFDIIRSLDFLQSRVVSAQWELLLSTPKIPDTNPGIQQLRQPIVDEMLAAQNADIIVNFDPKNSISQVSISDFSENERAARIMTAEKGFAINIQMAGAIQFINETIFARA